MADPPILPKGIVINTSWIYDEVAKQPVVPPEAIKKYWRVYTTTFQRLIDPTANRLENFWWHVWGSDRRYLPGPVLARLFEDISTGPTFVKLRGPPNRYEPPSQPPSPGSTPVQAPGVPAPSAMNHRTQQSKVEQRIIAPSSTKKPPGKPILKKPRGPSASGPRPTARFVSPLGSDAEEVGSRDSEVTSSSSTTVASGGELKVPSSSSTKESKKKTPTTGPPKKKGPTIVASAASRRRPAMPRRQSSQSATGGSDTAKDKARKESPGQTPETTESKLSAKAAGKRPAVQANVQAKSAEPSSAKHSSEAPADTQDQQAAVQTKQTTAQQPKHAEDKHTEDKKNDEPIVEESGQEKEPSAKPVHGTSGTREGARVETASSTAPPRPDPFSPRRGSSEASRGRRVIALTSASTAQTSTATAQGTIIEFDESLPTKQLAEESDRLPAEPEGTPTAPLDPRFTPTPPSATPAVPLGRSKSQLTLLLERQGEKKARR